MKLKYMTRFNEITAVEVEGETKDFVILKHRREKKRTDWMNYWDTKEEGVAHLISEQQAKLDRAKQTVQREEIVLAKLKDKFQPNTES